jgi:hypothetical protein
MPLDAGNHARWLIHTSRRLSESQKSEGSPLQLCGGARNRVSLITHMLLAGILWFPCWFLD